MQVLFFIIQLDSQVSLMRAKYLDKLNITSESSTF